MFAIKLLMNSCNPTFRTNSINQRLITKYLNYSTKAKKEYDIEEGPIKYTKSPAIRWRAEDSRTGGKPPRLWYEPYVLTGSIAVFLIYFTMIREENDVDQDLTRTLYSRIAGLEEGQLRASLEYNQGRGMDTSAIKKRLEEIQKERESI